MVIISCIEFRSQFTFFIKQQYDNIQSLFCILFKHKLHMLKNIPNMMLTNYFIYKFKDLYFHQIQQKFTDLSVQVNDRGILGLSTFIRILQFQSK